MRLARLAFALIVTAVISLRAEEVTVTKAELTAYGLYKEVIDTRQDNAKTTSGYINLLSEQVLLKKTDAFKGEIGCPFGIEYVITGEPEGASLALVIKIVHPPITDPETGRITTVEENTAESAFGEPNYDGFRFDEAWEIAPGRWTFQVYHGSQKLLEKTFTITP